jgi:peptidoglycan-associated lipoprotein
VVGQAEVVLTRDLQRELAVAAGDRVYFELDSATLTPEARAVLDRQAEWLVRNPAVTVLVAGNCDERGTREYNLALGARRAQAAFEHLAGRGVERARIRTISYGKERPIDPGADETAWVLNRNAQTLVGPA